MTNPWVERLPWLLLPVGVGIGLVASRQPILALALAIVIVLGWLGLTNPPLLVMSMFLGMLFDKLGLTGAKVSGFPITLSKLTVLAAMGVWGLRGIITRNERSVRWHPVLTAMLGMAAVAAVCVAWSNTMGEGKFIIFGLLMMSVMAGLVYAILATARMEILYRVVGVAFVFVLCSAVLGAGGSEAGRSSGTFGDPNEWATLVLLMTAFLLGGLVDEDHWLGRPLRLALLGLAPLTILMSASRSALVAGLILTPALLYLMRDRRMEILGVAGAGVAVAPFVLDLGKAWERVQSLLGNLSGTAVVRDNSLNERTELLHQGWALFMDNWLLGAGPGNFGVATGFVTLQGRSRPAHNTYLEIAAEQGIVGLIALGIFGIVVIWTLRDGLLAARTVQDKNRLLGAGIGLAGVAVMALTLGLLTFSTAYLVLGILLALQYQARHRRV